jgi:hypothetical protein
MENKETSPSPKPATQTEAQRLRQSVETRPETSDGSEEEENIYNNIEEEKLCLDCKASLTKENSKAQRKRCNHCLQTRKENKKPREGALKCNRCKFYKEEEDFISLTTFKSCSCCREKAKLSKSPKEKNKDGSSSINEREEPPDLLIKMFVYLKEKYEIKETLQNILMEAVNVEIE